MAHYEVVYSCGHAGDVYLTGKTSYREWRLKRLQSSVCLDCYKTRSYHASSQAAADLQLPQLEGTEKQVSWAETLRIEKIALIEEEVAKLDESIPNYNHVLLAMDKILRETSARWWIDARFDRPQTLLLQAWNKLNSEPSRAEKAAEKQEQERKVAEAEQRIEAERLARIEATIRPAESTFEIAAEITVQENIVSVRLPDVNDQFKTIVKNLGYEWKDKWWRRTIQSRAGTVQDRATELGCMLLSHGFPVFVSVSGIRDKIVSGVFVPEQTRWLLKITSGEHAGWICIKWGKNEDFYEAARRIPGSRYVQPHVVVPTSQFQQIEDFADRFQFSLGERAKEALQQARFDKEKMLVVEKRPATPPHKMVVGTQPPVLTIPEHIDVDDELKDND